MGLKLWQTYREEAVPLAAKGAYNSWAEFGFINRDLYDDARARETMVSVANVFPGIVEVFDSYPLGVMRADLWRMVILWAEGGVYADLDCRCLQHFDVWDRFFKRKDLLYIGLENSLHLCNWCIVSPSPLHDGLAFVVDKMIERARAGYDIAYEHFVHAVTGPGILTEAIGEYVNLKGKSAGQMLYLSPEYKERLLNMGVYLLREEVFREALCQNEFGSTLYPGFHSWTKEREALLNAED